MLPAVDPWLVAGMETLLIALFISASAHGLPAAGGSAACAGTDGNCAPVRSLAGKARRIDAVMTAEDSGPSTNPIQRTVHSTGKNKPAFNPAAKRPIA